MEVTVRQPVTIQGTVTSTPSGTQTVAGTVSALPALDRTDSAPTVLAATTTRIEFSLGVGWIGELRGISTRRTAGVAAATVQPAVYEAAGTNVEDRVYQQAAASAVATGTTDRTLSRPMAADGAGKVFVEVTPDVAGDTFVVSLWVQKGAQA